MPFRRTRLTTVPEIIHAAGRGKVRKEGVISAVMWLYKNYMISIIPVMPTTSVDLPEILYQYIESEVEDGRYKSKAEAIRDMIRKEMERKHAVDETLSEETVEKIQQARERGEIEGEVRELIEDLL